MGNIEVNKPNKLTQNIFIGLVLGILVGFLLNKYVIHKENEKIQVYDKQISTLNSELSKLNAYKDSAFSKPIKKLKKEIAKDTLAKIQFDKLVAAEKNYKLKIDSVSEIIADLNAAKKPFVEGRDSVLQWFTALSENIFLNLIKMIVALLVFSTLVVGIAKLGDIKAVGRIGVKTLLWFLSASFISLLLGLVLVNLFEPGRNMQLEIPDKSLETGIQKTAVSFKEFLNHVFPKSPIEAMAKNEILQIVVFSLFFGIACAAIGKRTEKIVDALDDLSVIILKITGYVMLFAPFAVFGAMAAVIAKQGIGIITTYIKFIAQFYFGLAILWVILLLAGSLFLKKRIFKLIDYIKDPILLAFSTASSEAAFPKTMEGLEKFGADKKITSFVLPLGYSFNLDGSMMYMTFASLFIAQCYGINLGISTQLAMLLVLMLTSKGIAGVPRASLVVIAGTLASFNIPEAGLALLLGIDPLLDMGRSATNVVGNSVATAVVDHWENNRINNS